MTNEETFVETCAKAKTLEEKAMCLLAKLVGAHVVTPLGRVKLLPSEYAKFASATENGDLNE